MEEAVIMYDSKLDGREYEQTGIPGILKGTNNKDNGEIFKWFDVTKVSGEDQQLIGDWARVMEKHAAACAALYLKEKQSLGNLPQAVTRHYQIAQSKPVYDSDRLCIRSYVQHLFPDSRNITVLTEAIAPPTEIDASPQSCIRLVSNVLIIKTKETGPEKGEYYSFHRDNNPQHGKK